MTSKQKREKGGVNVTWQPTVLLKNTDSNEERRVYHKERGSEWRDIVEFLLERRAGRIGSNISDGVFSMAFFPSMALHGKSCL